MSTLLRLLGILGKLGLLGGTRMLQSGRLLPSLTFFHFLSSVWLFSFLFLSLTFSISLPPSDFFPIFLRSVWLIFISSHPSDFFLVFFAQSDFAPVPILLPGRHYRTLRDLDPHRVPEDWGWSCMHSPTEYNYRVKLQGIIAGYKYWVKKPICR